LKTTRKKDMDKLRKRLDGNDGFMSAHQIKKVRVLTGQKDTPPWATSDIEVRKILLRAFPNLMTHKGQRQSAARWNQAIALVYRIGMPYNHAAAEMGISTNVLRCLLRRIRCVANGLRSDTIKPRNGSRGRPKLK
jgi:tryptophan 2,3-dioxygenase